MLFMRKYILGFLVFVSSFVYSQTETFVTSGKVFDSATSQALAGASVFCQNTTIGTITNAEGGFAMRLPKGGYDLIISYTGYETQNLHINASNATDIKIDLKTKEKACLKLPFLAAMKWPMGWKNMASSLSIILSVQHPTRHSASSRIRKSCNFFSKKRNRLKVKEKEDLVIVNNALGYKIKYQLDSFSYEYGTDVSTYSGYPFFEELEGTDQQKATWKLNRLKAYNGSRLHFVRSWYDSTLSEEGFALERVDPSKKTLTTRPIEDPYDSTHYAVLENEDVEINWTGKLRVIYKNEMPDKKFLVQYKLPLYLKSQITILEIVAPFIIEQNGYFYEQTDMINTGYWSWEKAAEALPYDYSPE